MERIADSRLVLAPVAGVMCGCNQLKSPERTLSATVADQSPVMKPSQCCSVEWMIWWCTTAVCRRGWLLETGSSSADSTSLPRIAIPARNF